MNTSEEIGSSRTPGPWSIDPRTGLDVRGPDGKDVCVALCQEMGGLQFEMSTIGPERRQQAFDNALLIAAAPDLLEIVCEFCEYAGGMEYDTYRAFIQRATEVIAKAEGRS